MSKSAPALGRHLAAPAFTTRTLTLDPKQAAAAAHRGSPLIIRGATGTGKTTTLIECAIDRIKKGAATDSILILTYGRERASEIRDAIVISAGGTVQEPVARTLHALAFSILQMSAGENFRETVLISGA